MAAISPSVFSGPYTANGTQAAFPFDFSIMDAAGVTVLVNGTVLPSGYSVSFGPTSGTVNFTSAPASGAIILLKSTPDFLQTSEFENEGAYKLSTVNAINRRAAVKSLVLKDVADRSVTVPLGSVGFELPDTISTDALIDLAGLSDEIQNISDNVADISAVADNATNINVVAANAASITTVASNIGSVNTAATNIAAIIAAPAAATTATTQAGIATAAAASLGSLAVAAPSLASPNPSTSANSVITTRQRSRKNRALVSRPVTASTIFDTFYIGADADGDGFDSNVGSVAGFAAGAADTFLAASYVGGATVRGMPTEGLVRRVEIPIDAPVGTGGGKVQFFLYRPRTALANASAAVTFDLVARLGEMAIPESAAGGWVEFHPRIAAYALPGDLIFRRCINFGLWSGVNAYAADWSFVLPAADTSLNGAPAVLTGTSGSGRRYAMRVELNANPFATATNGLSGNLQLNATGDIDDRIGRAADMLWRDKKVTVLGTSIEVSQVGVPGGIVVNSDTNWVGQLFKALQCLGDNQAVSGSYATYHGSANEIGLAGTIAQLVASADGNSLYGQFSYENKVVAAAPDLLIDCHGFNDRASTIGTIDSTDVATFYGAKNKIYGAYKDAVPGGRILIVTPSHEWGSSDPSTSNPTIKDVRIEAIRQACFALAEKWGARVADITRSCDVSPKTIAQGILPDNTHPAQRWHDIMWRAVYRVALAS